MSYSSKVVLAANEILSQRRVKAENTRSIRHTEVIAKIPNIREYEIQLANTGAEIVKGIAMGEDAEKFIKELSEINLSIQKSIRALLIDNGYPEDYLATPYTCKKCEDTGYVGGYICECKKALLRELNVSELGKSAPVDRCTFESFKLSYYKDEPHPVFNESIRTIMEDVLSYCKTYADDFNINSNSLMFMGKTGLGKTHLSVAIANEVAKKGYNVVYDTAQNLFSELEREKFNSRNTGEAEQRFLNCDLLIIDDLGSEFSTQFTVAALYNIINTRLNKKKPVIISTNLEEKELEKKYSERTVSRIISEYCPLTFYGNDIRQIKSEED